MDTNLTRASFSNDITWREAVDDFLLHICAIREEGTEKFYRDRLKHLVKLAESNGVTVQGFHARHLRQYLASRVGEISDATRRHDAVVTKALLKFCCVRAM